MPVGQRLMEMKYFASRPNDVSGVDRDVIVQGLDLRGYLRVLRANGAKRTVKTIGRKLLRIDARYTAELARQLDVPRFPRLPVCRMDASALSFDDDTFDFVYSLAVFQHLETPKQRCRDRARAQAGRSDVRGLHAVRQLMVVDRLAEPAQPWHDERALAMPARP